MGIKALVSTVREIKKPGATPTSAANAAAWNRPGGGYDQWKAGDPAREAAQPIGAPAKQRKAEAVKKVKNGH